MRFLSFAGTAAVKSVAEMDTFMGKSRPPDLSDEAYRHAMSLGGRCREKVDDMRGEKVQLAPSAIYITPRQRDHHLMMVWELQTLTGLGRLLVVHGLAEC